MTGGAAVDCRGDHVCTGYTVQYTAISMLRAVPAGIVRPAYAASGVLPRRAAAPIVKTAAQIDAMRVAGRIAATMRERAGLMCKVWGVSMFDPMPTAPESTYPAGCDDERD